jgi:hypothetical protein
MLIIGLRLAAGLIAVLIFAAALHRALSTSSGAPHPTPTAIRRATPVLSPTPVAGGLRGEILFGDFVTFEPRGVVLRHQHSHFLPPSDIAWLAFLSHPVSRATVQLQIVRFGSHTPVVWQRAVAISDMTVHVLTFVVAADEWRHYGLNRPGVYGVRYVLHRHVLARGLFFLMPSRQRPAPTPGRR